MTTQQLKALINRTIPQNNPIDINSTLNGALLEIINAAFPYDVYLALLTQTGIGVPVETVISNTTGFTFTYTRGTTGTYTIVPSDQMILTRRVVSFSTINSNRGVDVQLTQNTITFVTYNNVGTNTDGLLLNTMIQIFVFP